MLGVVVGLGVNFSFIEQRVVLSMLLQKYIVKLPPGQENAELSFQPTRVLAPKNLFLEFEPIKG